MPTSDSASLLVGILVGGASRRMGGQPKGLLWAPGGQERIVPRLLRLTQESLPEAGVFLLGAHAAYADLGARQLDDALPGAGPLAGLVSLLRAAVNEGRRHVLLLAGDLPRVTSPLLERLASIEVEAPAVAPWIDERYQPLFARYATSLLPAAEALLESADRSLQRLLRSASAAHFPLNDAELAALSDWDEPSDIADS